MRITESCDELFSLIPLVLLFLSQFVLGIGQTLYLSLGQPYIDDNSRRTNTAMMLAYAMSLRMCGPVAGYALGYITLKMYIDPTKTPLIGSDDPRWLGNTKKMLLLLGGKRKSKKLMCYRRLVAWMDFSGSTNVDFGIVNANVSATDKSKTN